MTFLESLVFVIGLGQVVILGGLFTLIFVVTKFFVDAKVDEILEEEQNKTDKGNLD